MKRKTSTTYFTSDLEFVDDVPCRTVVKTGNSRFCLFLDCLNQALLSTCN